MYGRFCGTSLHRTNAARPPGGRTAIAQVRQERTLGPGLIALCAFVRSARVGTSVHCRRIRTETITTLVQAIVVEQGARGVVLAMRSIPAPELGPSKVKIRVMALVNGGLREEVVVDSARTERARGPLTEPTSSPATLVAPICTRTSGASR